MNVIDPAYPVFAILAGALFVIKTESLISVAWGNSAVLFQRVTVYVVVCGSSFLFQLIKSRGITPGSLEAISGFKPRLEYEGRERELTT